MISKTDRPRRLLLALAIAATAATATAQDLAVKGGRIIPVVGEPIDDGVVLIRDGKIAAVGKDVEIPVEAKVVDAAGKVVLPGFVEPHTAAPLVQANEVNPNVPYVTVVDAIDPSNDSFEDARRNGVTSIHAIPGNSTMIGGKSAVVKSAGTFVDDMILRRDVAMKLSLAPANGRSRMSHLARLRAELEETKRYIDKLDKKKAEKEEAEKEKEDEDESKEGDDARAPQDEQEKPDEEKPEADDEDADEPDDQREAMVALVKGELPCFIYCPQAMDVPHALALVKDYGLKATLVLGRDCYKAVDLIAESELPVVLDPELVFWETDPRTDEDERIILPRIYREAGVPITFQTEGSPSFVSTTLGRNFLWYQAATAVKYGMPKAEALEALTIRPAKLLGVDEFVGSIEEGKDGDLVILSGEPLAMGTWVDATVIEGEVVYRREDDKRLAELLRPDEEDDEAGEEKGEDSDDE